MTLVYESRGGRARAIRVRQWAAEHGADRVLANGRPVDTVHDLLDAAHVDSFAISALSGLPYGTINRYVGAPIMDITMDRLDRFAGLLGLYVEPAPMRDVDWGRLADDMFPDRRRVCV